MESATAPLILHTDWSRAYGGQEIRVLTELREMRRLGFRVALVVPEKSDLAARAQAEQIEVHPVSFRSKFHLDSWRALFNIFRQLRPAVVNTHSSEDSWMAGCVAKLCGVPLIARTRHVLAPISSAVSYNLFPHVIFTCSEAICEQLVSQGVKREKCVIQPTGIDEKRFTFNQEDRDAVRRSHGIRQDQVLIGNVAFLRHYKGHPFIIKTLAQLDPKYHVMIVGSGGELPALKQLAAQVGVEDRVTFVPHQEQVERYFSAFDLCFFSSYEGEGVSQSLVQGLLNGLPTLGCTTPSVMEVLERVEGTALVDYDDTAAAAASLEQLFSLYGCRQQSVARDTQWLRNRYGLEKMIQSLAEVYARHGVTPPSHDITS